MKIRTTALYAAGLLTTFASAENCWVGAGARYADISFSHRLKDNLAPDGVACRHDLYGRFAELASALEYTTTPYALCCDDCCKFLPCVGYPIERSASVAWL